MSRRMPVISGWAIFAQVALFVLTDLDLQSPIVGKRRVASSIT